MMMARQSKLPQHRPQILHSELRLRAAGDAQFAGVFQQVVYISLLQGFGTRTSLQLAMPVGAATIPLAVHSSQVSLSCLCAFHHLIFLVPVQACRNMVESSAASRQNPGVLRLEGLVTRGITAPALGPPRIFGSPGWAQQANSLLLIAR